MQPIKKTWFSRFRRMFKRKLKPYLVESKYRVVPAFSIGNKDYWMFDSTTEVPTGRFFAAMGVYYEMEMNCDKKYIQDHCDAVDKIISDPKKISIKNLALLNNYLRERTEMMPYPEFIYKLASVIFFDDTESLYAYDYEYNKGKIERWKAAGGTLDFFLATPLKELVPSLKLPKKDTQTYLMVSEQVQRIHLAHLTNILSETDLKREKSSSAN